jgi:hypothetical protein
MKTAMQELIEFIESTNNTPHVNLTIMDKAKKLLEKEKEQIIEAHTNAYLIGEDYIKVEYANKESEHYYNQTYNQNK